MTQALRCAKEKAVTRRVLICDLNNFARYPTISVGYLVAVLRRAGMHVEVFSPWSVGIGGFVREAPVRPWGLIDQRLRFWSAFSASPLVHELRRSLRAVFAPSDLSREARRLERWHPGCTEERRMALPAVRADDEAYSVHRGVRGRRSRAASPASAT